MLSDEEKEVKTQNVSSAYWLKTPYFPYFLISLDHSPLQITS